MMDDRSKFIPLAATVAICSLATLYWKTSSKKDELASDDVVVDLLPIERILAGGGGGDNAMSTLTWFQGDHKRATTVLRERAIDILKANPWLAGRVKKLKGTHALIYPKSPILDDYFHITPDLISRDVPLSDLGNKLAKRLLKTGAIEPLWKVQVLPCAKNPSAHFAVVFSMSHVIADGATFYKLQNMLLDSTTKIDSLIVERIPDTVDKQIQVMGGKEEYGLLASAGFIVNCIGGVIQAVLNKKKYKASSRIYLVDKPGMGKAKHAAGQETHDNAPAFASSNDVLTSWFLQNCNCQHGLMALNFRGRLDGHTDQHAGNYENCIFYRREDSSSPTLIRKSITSKDGVYRRQVTVNDPMPGFRAMVTSSNAICSNWSSFAKACNVEGCIEDVQLPLFDVAALLPSTMAICLVFRAGPKGLAVFVAGSPDKLEGLAKTVPFLKQDEVMS